MTTAIETTIATKTEHEIPGALLQKKVQVAVDQGHIQTIRMP